MPWRWGQRRYPARTRLRVWLPPTSGCCSPADTPEPSKLCSAQTPLHISEKLLHSQKFLEHLHTVRSTQACHRGCRRVQRTWDGTWAWGGPASAPQAQRAVPGRCPGRSHPGPMWHIQGHPLSLSPAQDRWPQNIPILLRDLNKPWRLVQRLLY